MSRGTGDNVEAAIRDLVSKTAPSPYGASQMDPEDPEEYFHGSGEGYYQVDLVGSSGQDDKLWRVLAEQNDDGWVAQLVAELR